MDFSRRLEQIRSELNMTQQELADKLNVTRATISNYEKGLRTPDINFLYDFLLFCKSHGYEKVTFDYLMGYTNSFAYTSNQVVDLLFLSDKALKHINSMTEKERSVINCILEYPQIKQLFQLLSLFQNEKSYYEDSFRYDFNELVATRSIEELTHNKYNIDDNDYFTYKDIAQALISKHIRAIYKSLNYYFDDFIDFNDTDL